MKLPRRSRLVAAAITLFSILFMQFAVAAYACPALEIGHGQTGQSASMSDMASCAEVDPDEPSLCFAHDQVGNQSLDKPTVPPLQSFIPIGFWLPLSTADATPEPFQSADQVTFLQHAIAPPLAVRNCCFRI